MFLSSNPLNQWHHVINKSTVICCNGLLRQTMQRVSFGSYFFKLEKKNLGHHEPIYFKLAITQFFFFYVESKTTQGHLPQNPETCLGEAKKIQLLSQTLSRFRSNFPHDSISFLKEPSFPPRARITYCGTIARHASAPRLTQPQSPAQSGNRL